MQHEAQGGGRVRERMLSEPTCSMKLREEGGQGESAQ